VGVGGLQRVDHGRAGRAPGPLLVRAPGELQARDTAAQRGAVAPPAEGSVVPAGTRLQILEMEPKDVVALDHVRVTLPDDPRALLEELALVEPVAPHDVTEARGVGDSDRDDLVAGARSAGELVALGRDDLDIERQAPEATEGEA